MRRSPGEVAALERSIMSELIVRPGQSRAEVLGSLGVDPSAHDRPLINLVQSGRVLRAGHKSDCRYRPGGRKPRDHHPLSR